MQRQQWRKNGKNLRKSRHGSWRKSETRKKWSMKQGKKGWKVHFASLMDLCHLKNSELEPQYRKYKGRVVLRGDIVKDDSGSYAVFTEQRSSASQMTATKVMDIISRFPGCSGQAADAVSAKNSGQNGRCINVIQKQSQNVQIFGYLYRSTNGQNHGPVWKTQLFLLNGIYTVILYQDCYGKGNSRKSFLESGWEKVPNWETFFVDRENGLFLSVYVDDIKLAGKTENMGLAWKILMKDVDLGEPTSFLDHVYLGCTQRECPISNNIVANYRDMFESRISAGAKENCRPQLQGNLMQK